MKTLGTLEPRRRRNLLTLFGTGLLFWSSLTCLLPTLPLYIEEVAGGTHQDIGFVMGAFAIGLLLSRGVLGRLADRQGRRLVLLVGTMVVAIAPFGYLLVKSVPLLMAIRAFHGISIAAFTTGYSALVTDLAPKHQRGELIGYMSLVTPIGMAIGPAIGGFVQAGAGYAPLFLLSVGLGIASFLCTYQIKNLPVDEEDRSDAANRLSLSSKTPPASDKFWSLLVSPRLRIPTLVMALIGVAFGTLTTFVPLFIKEMQVGLNAGWFYTSAAIASFSVRIFTGKASDRYGRGLFITAGLVLYCVAMGILWKADSSADFLLAGVLEGAGAGTLLPMMIALLSDRSRFDERGRVFSLGVGGFDLGIAVAGPILGSVADQVGYSTMFGLSAGFALLALIVFVTQSSKDLSHSLRFALGRASDLYALSDKG